MGKLDEFYKTVEKEYDLEIAEEFKKKYQVNDPNFSLAQAINTLDKILLDGKKPIFPSMGRMNSPPTDEELIFRD